MANDKEIEMMMRDSKNSAGAEGRPVAGDVESSGADEPNMAGYGQQRSQQVISASGMPRYITMVSTINFSYIILCSWEAFAVSFQFALYNGGPASLVYGTILVMFGATAVALSLAELASIDPAVGAQYRWTASLAPKFGKFFGLLQGWITVFAWVMACAGPPSFMANIITSLAQFNYPDYKHHNWHTMLIMWGFILVPYILNIWVQKTLNVFEVVGGILHFLFFVVTVVVLLTLARRSTNEFVWETLFVDLSGWSNPGVNWGLGMTTVAFAVSGFDGVLHMSDEVKNVQKGVPRSIIISTVFNSLMLFAFVIVILYCIGDVDIVSSPQYASLPLIPVYYLATKSHAATTILVLFVGIIFFVVLFNAFASVSRLTWSFARDNGLPFSKFFAYVSPRRGFPVNALGLIAVVSFLISILYVITPVAFNAAISLQALGLSMSYVMPILFICIRKIRKQHPQYGPFALGRYGIPTNLFALAYLIYIIIWIPFPQVLPITATYFNYSGPLVGAVILGGIIDYAINGRKRFAVPLHGKLDQVSDKEY